MLTKIEESVLWGVQGILPEAQSPTMISLPWVIPVFSLKPMNAMDSVDGESQRDTIQLNKNCTYYISQKH